MTIIADSLQAIQANIHQAKLAAKRDDEVKLLAVSKAQPPEKLREAYLAGQRAFGENYVQEAISKQVQLTDCAIEWHFIGPIQSNKTQLIAQHFDWVHSVDRLKIAARLNEARPPSLAPLNVCIQINSSEEASKSGVDTASLAILAKEISAMPRLKLRGLMAIPAPSKDLTKQRAQFKIVGDAFMQLQQQGFELDTLSIGMSDDYVAAIHEGATIVRIGSTIFGARPSRQNN
ncbi:MAG TPA: YggS family pyridoxal phosphate-dependent enzyme [Methylotenera sp.]|nr:YggS family pyridoxal phosphate-dependent enzyme [Methylotenera sp.]HPV44087.1 YggS family pyridoxal phosphate-dependent enzyme [Methylotenera sp.]